MALHLAGATVSLALLASTFVSKGIITAKAHSIAIEKSRLVSDPLVAKLADALEHPVYGKTIPSTAREKLEREMADYNLSPDTWLRRLAEGGPDRAKDFSFPEIKNPLARKTVDAISKGVSALKDHLEESYRDLIGDIRLFAATNIAAFGIAAWLSWIARTPRSRHWLIPFSGLMLWILAISIHAYLGQNWTWSILTGSYMGWTYPAVLGFTTIYGIYRITPDLAKSDPGKLPPTP